jgi:bloom syndrome protein
MSNVTPQLRMDVLQTPAKGASKPKARTTAKKSKTQEDPPTNVSSPIAHTKRQKAVLPDESNDEGYDVYDYHDDGQAEVEESDAGSMDDFVVGDDFVEYDDGAEERFHSHVEAPVPNRKGIGNAITADETMSRLSSSDRFMVEGCVAELSRECRNLMQSYNMRYQPFTETQLREMAIRLPETLAQLRSIDGINSNSVDLLGDRFLKLIKNFKQTRHEFSQPNTTSYALQPPAQSTRKTPSYKPYDPNREEVIIIDDDDDDFVQNLPVSSPDFEQSRFFSQRVDPAVEEFNRIHDLTQRATQTTRPTSTLMQAPTLIPARGGGRSRATGRGGASKGRRRSGSRKFMSKRGGSNGSRGRRGGGAGRGGSGLNGGIGMMPV